MKIMEFLSQDAIAANLKSTDKKGIIKELVGLLSKAYSIKDKDKLIKTVMNRESLGSTGIGQGIGIPHAKSNAVKEVKGVLGISRAGVDFDSLDGEPTHIFFLLIAPEDAAGPHLKALAKISSVLKDKFFRDSLIAAKNEKTLFSIINKADQKNQ